jgi:hypothetical protein
MYKKCVHMYVNEKMLKLFQEWGDKGIRDNNEVGEFKCDISDTLLEFL